MIFDSSFIIRVRGVLASASHRALLFALSFFAVPEFGEKANMSNFLPIEITFLYIIFNNNLIKSIDKVSF